MLDIHCHLYDLQKQKSLSDNLLKLNDQNRFFSVATNQQEVDWHLANRKLFDGFYAGIHPLDCDKNPIDVDYLIALCEAKNILAIGEIGLDKREDNFKIQKDILLKQLEIAAIFDLPVVFHVVKDYYRLAKIVRDNFPKTRGILHGFNSSLEVVDLYKKMGFAFSIGCRPPQENVLHKILEWGRFFIETDAPFQAPFGSGGDNKLSNIEISFQILAKLSNENYIREQLDINENEFF